MYYTAIQEGTTTHVRYCIGLEDIEFKAQWGTTEAAKQYLSRHFYDTLQFNIEDLVNKHRLLAINVLSEREHYKKNKSALIDVQALKMGVLTRDVSAELLLKEMNALAHKFHALIPPPSSQFHEEIRQQTVSLFNYTQNLN